MKTERLYNTNAADFISYCRKYAAEHDESNIPNDDFRPRDDEPAFLLRDDSNMVIGAASVMLHREYVEAGKARFRIFHCVDKLTENYSLLLKEIEAHSRKVDFIYCYITEGKTETRDIWTQLGFDIWRYSWVLARNTLDFTPSAFPEDFEIRTLRDGIDEAAYCDIINEAFLNMLGHTHLRPEKIDGWRKDKSYIPGGMKLLWDKKINKPVGTITMIKENEGGEEVVFIEGIALLNSYRGRGLGKNLLRYGLEFARDYGVKKAMLSVNAENSNAADLYIKEGFKKAEIYICYNKKIK